MSRKKMDSDGHSFAKELIELVLEALKLALLVLAACFRLLREKVGQEQLDLLRGGLGGVRGEGERIHLALNGSGS